MNQLNLPPGTGQPDIPELVARINQAEAALQAACDHEVDAACDASGRFHLLHEAQQALRDSEHKLRQLVQALPGAVYTCDVQGRITLFNQAAVDLWGRDPEPDKDRWCGSWQIYDPKGAPIPLEDCPMAQAIREGRPIRGREIVIARPDGSRRHILPYPEPIRDSAGVVVGAVNMLVDFTEREQTETEMRRTTGLLRAVAEGTTDAVFVKDLQGRYLLFNEAAARFVGRKVEEVLGQDDRAIFGPADARIIMENDRRVLETGAVQTTEEDLTAAGVTRTYLATKAPYRDEHGHVIGLIGISRDISERKRHERRLAVFSRLGQRLNAVASPRQAGEVIVQAAEELFGWDSACLKVYSPEQDQIEAVLTMDTIEGHKAHCPPAYTNAPPSPQVRRILEQGKELVLRSEPLKADSNLKLFGNGRPSASLMYVPVRDGARSIGILSIQSYRFQAYTPDDLEVLQLLADYCGAALQRIHVEAQRRLSEERFHLLSKATNDAIWDWNLVTGMVWWSEGFEHLFGYRRDEADPTIKSWTDNVHPEDLQRVKTSVYQAIECGEKTWSAEYRFRCKDGNYAYVLDRGHILRDASGKPVRMIGGMTDLSERRKNEEKLREQATLLDIAHEAILVKDMAHRIIYWNKGAQRIYGWTAEEVLGRKSSEVLYKDPTRFQEAVGILLDKGEWQGELLKQTKSGKDLTIDVRWTLVRDASGKPKSILAINTDITEKKKLESQFLRAQRMESIGTLAGGIAHDLNNVLAPILMSVQVLKIKMTDADDLELLNTLESSSRRGADLVKQVLGFARGVEGQRVTVNPLHLMRELMQVMPDMFPKNIEVRFTPAHNLRTVVGDPTQLHQVLLNLCVNARDAMPRGGNLTITMENVEIDETYAAMNPDARPGSFAMVRVADTGTGIPPEIREKIFEPFFTTKEVGKGTGLGLATTAAIVKSHGGFITLYSEVGKGTQFKVYLPAHTTQAAAESVAVEQVRLPRGQGELVLVVDDEEAIRKIAQRTLEGFGYRVVLARHGAEAVSIYARRQQEIAVVITDMSMPIMDGPALITALKAMNPQIRIIGSSGLASRVGSSKNVGADVVQFIPKPYNAETILKALQLALSGA